MHVGDSDEVWHEWIFSIINWIVNLLCTGFQKDRFRYSRQIV